MAPSFPENRGPGLGALEAPSMTWDSLTAVRNSLLEFSRESGLRRAHSLVRLASGKWTRVLGVPGPQCRHVRGNIWEVKP